MPRAVHLAFVLLALGAAAAPRAAQPPAPDLRTRAEITDFAETSTAADVTRVIDALKAASPLLHVESFGSTEEGRDLPLLVLSDPATKTPEAARALQRPVVFVMANIHGGEVEGKEASLILARRLLTGDLRPLLKQLVVVIAPNYNADGNERIDVQHRTAQNGPVGGVGTRENAKGLDLNRDAMKLESAEARALVGVFQRWDPHLVMDLHTTNGSYHGYHLTYSPPLHPNTDARITAFTREQVLWPVHQAMFKEHAFRTYYYGNFASEAGQQRETARVDPQAPGDTIWRTFDHRPRFVTNYVGLRNRLVILSEAYSYLDFRGRVGVTERFVEETLRVVSRRANDIRTLTAQVDRDTASARRPLQQGIAFTVQASPQPVEILVGDVEKRPNPRSGKDVSVMSTTVTPVRMKEYGSFTATRSLAMPKGWVIPKGAVDAATLERVIALLKQHGVGVRVLGAAQDLAVEQFRIATLTRAERAFQGRRAVMLTGAYAASRQHVEAGSVVIDASQPLARVAFYLLEPESDDGLVAWNIVDEGLAAEAVFPVWRLR